MKKLVSIIVPVFNVERYLRQCLDSILGQTFNQFEVIIVNDGSTDNSGAPFVRNMKHEITGYLSRERKMKACPKRVI